MDCVALKRAVTPVSGFLDAVTHVHAVHYVIAAMTMRDRSTIRPDAAYAVDTTSTDHGICVVASLGQ